MILDHAMPITQESGWRLLLEFVLPSRQHVVERIAAAVRGLGLQPSQAGRVEHAAIKALQEAVRPCSQGSADSTVAIRLWTSEACAGSPQPATRAALEAGLPQDRGWGFFVVQTQEDELPASVGGSRHLVDLFLYQEG